MIDLWNNAKLRITVDRGTERWLTFCEKLKSDCGSEVTLNPDIVSGDLDSLDPSILQHMRSLGCEIRETEDQDNTDFRKAVGVVIDKKIELDSLLVVGEHSGRLDHIVSNLNVHFTTDELLSNKNVQMYHLAGDSLTWLLKPGHHKIRIPQRLRDCNAWCSLLPVGTSCNVTSTGLKYNMENSRLELGGLVSSSNTYDSDKESVELLVDKKIIWSMGLGFKDDLFRSSNFRRKSCQTAKY
ncbi:thiamin pyrophosphokinase 1 isoform X2 [Nilaparvata lugens]|nr:thiamin pyrophosphokinase 1 isoform X2 [Nilaparvata lugens]